MSRPFRLEVDGFHFDVPTYSTLERAQDGVVTFERHRRVARGTKWHIVERVGRNERIERARGVYE